MACRTWIEADPTIAVVRQCELADVARSTVYAQRRPSEVDETELLLCRLMDEESTCRSFYSSRRMVVFLKGQGHEVNRNGSNG